MTPLWTHRRSMSFICFQLTFSPSRGQRIRVMEISNSSVFRLSTGFQVFCLFHMSLVVFNCRYYSWHSSCVASSDLLPLWKWTDDPAFHFGTVKFIYCQWWFILVSWVVSSKKKINRNFQVAQRHCLRLSCLNDALLRETVGNWNNPFLAQKAKTLTLCTSLSWSQVPFRAVVWGRRSNTGAFGLCFETEVRLCIGLVSAFAWCWWRFCGEAYIFCS